MFELSHTQSTPARRVTPKPDNHQKRVTQQISIVLSTLLFIAFATYPIYICLAEVSKTMVISKPSLHTYQALYAEQPPMLTCTCSQSLIPYQNFMHLKYSLHPLCQSGFIEPTWIAYLAKSTGPKYPFDFRSTSSSSFQSLSTFCQLIPLTIEQSLSQLNSHPYTSVQITPESVLLTQISSQISQFISTTENSFSLSLSLIRHQIQSDALLSALQTIDRNNTCDCATSPTCAMPSSIYNYSNGARLFDVPGFYTGCYITDSLLQSDLQCLFNQTCLNRLQTFLSPAPSMNITALDPSLLMKYSPTTSVHALIEHLLVQQWNISISYSSYYAVCEPDQCTYTVMTRNDRTTLATMLIGLIGGLIAILNFAVPRIVKFMFFVAHTSEPAVVRTMTVISRA